MSLRDQIMRALESLRQGKKIASNQEAGVTIYSGDQELTNILNEFGLDQFAAFCIVSQVTLQSNAAETSVVAEKSTHQKCQRCWNYWQSVGTDSNYADLCSRCVQAITK